MRSSATRWITAAAASTLVLAGVAAPSAASAPARSHADIMRAATSEGGSGSTWSPTRTSAAAGEGRIAAAADSDVDTTCFTDPAGDVRQDPDGARTPAAEPRADVVEHCVAFGPTVSLSLRVQQPTDPLTDAGWQQATFAGWFVDTDGDGNGDYFVDFSLEAGEDEPTLGAHVQQLRSGQDAVEVCSAELVTTDTGWYSVSHIAPTCFGGATTIRVQAGFFYEDEDGDVNYDAAPDGSGFTAGIAQGDDTRRTSRLAGAERIATSVEISKQAFPGGASRVFLARSHLFADAVAGGVLQGGPILLVPSCDAQAPQVVKDEVERLGATTVYALGGHGAICDTVLRDAAGDAATGRIQGRTRIETAVEISRFTYPDPDTVDEVYLARQDVFADAVAGGVLQGGPILLVPNCGDVPDEVKQEIGRLNPDRVYALGGEAAVCDAMLAGVAGARPTARLAGPTRLETSLAISQHAFPKLAGTVHIARAFPNDKLADSVAGGVLQGGPVLLVPECADALPLNIAGEISRLGPTEVIALGGDQAVCDQVLSQAGAA